MKLFLTRLLGNTSNSAAPPTPPTKKSKTAEPDDEIPRYPPFAKGLPNAAVDRVLATQQELIDRIRHTLALSVPDFDHYVAPVLRNYAAYVHLLPASEAHHHRGAGGLFRHGLEVAFWAAQSAEGIIFTYSSSPREKREQEPRWRLAACLAGLLHDIGKPVSDLSVTSKDGSVIWNPYGETLYSWATTQDIDRYFLRWRPGRHKRHEQFSVLVVDKIVPHETLDWLTKPGPEILQAMLEAISSPDENHVVASLVLRADNTSVQRDLKAHNIVQSDGSLGVPVEKYILDAMRRLINSSTWLINQKGARVWILQDGPYVVWKQGAEDITKLLAADRVPGIPRDPDTLADILIERDLAVPQQGPAGSFRYWTVAPDVLVLEDGSRVRLPMLRLTSNEVLFSSEPPPATGAIIERLSDPQASSEREDDGESEHPPVETAVSIKQKSKTAAKAVPMPKEIGDPLEEAFGTGGPAKPKSQGVPTAPAAQVPDGKKRPPSGGKDTPATDPFADGPKSAGEALDILFGGDEQDIQGLFERAKASTPAAPPSRPAAPPRLPSGAPSATDPAWLESLPGEGGETLRAIVKKVKETPKLWGKALDVAQNRVVINYPDGAAAFNEPPYVLKTLEEAGALDLDPATPMRKIRQWGQLKGLVLNDRASAVLLLLRPAQEKAAPPAKLQPPLPAAQEPAAAHPQADLFQSPPDAVGTAPTSPSRKPAPAAKPTRAAAESPPKKGGNNTPPPERRVTPSATATDVAQRLLADIRAGGKDLSVAVLRVDSRLVVPQTVVPAYARRHKVSPWELRAAIDRAPGCEIKDTKLYVQESADVHV